MWHIQECDVRETTLDTGSDIFGRIETHAVFAGDVMPHQCSIVLRLRN
jgi:hypothetical protein